jgi:hypothetical protein
MVRCGDCLYFVRDGLCDYLQTPAGRSKDRLFSHAPFWVWSDCYSDKEQVRANVESLCPTFCARPNATLPAADLALAKSFADATHLDGESLEQGEPA